MNLALQGLEKRSTPFWRTAQTIPLHTKSTSFLGVANNCSPICLICASLPPFVEWFRYLFHSLLPFVFVELALLLSFSYNLAGIIAATTLSIQLSIHSDCWDRAYLLINQYGSGEHWEAELWAALTKGSLDQQLLELCSHQQHMLSHQSLWKEQILSMPFLVNDFRWLVLRKCSLNMAKQNWQQ